MKRILLFASIIALLSVWSTNTFAADRATIAKYYSSLKGLKKEELKKALGTLLRQHKTLGYGKGKGNVWDAFYTTDRKENNEVVNRYSSEKFTFPSTNNYQDVAGMNIEHSFPKSWWGKTENPANSDIHHLYPSPSKDNSQKGNFPMAIVTTVKHNSGAGYDKVGTGTIEGKTQNCWEPGDTWKGDFARSYMYMATTYSNLTWVKMGLVTNITGEYPTLKSWASTLYRQWSKNDKVSEIETKRNDAVYAIQGNRNPFIDYPFIAEYIWGDSVNVSFDPNKAITTASDDSRYGSYAVTPSLPDAETTPSTPETTQDENVIYNLDIDNGWNTLEKNNITLPTGSTYVWTHDKTHKVFKASAYVNKQNLASEALLITPEIDLTNYKDITLDLEHALKFGNHENLSVEVVVDGTTEVLNIPVWGDGKSFKAVKATAVSLEKYAGKKVKLQFRYKSTTTNCPTWQIKSMSVKGTKVTTGINSTTNDAFAQPNFDEPYELFTIDGMKLDSNNSNYRGIVILKQGNKTWKIYKR